MSADAQTIDISKPPEGWAVIANPFELNILFLQDNLRAVTVLPRDQEATQFFCENLMSAFQPPVSGCKTSFHNKVRRAVEVGRYYFEQDRVSFIPDDCQPLRVSRHSTDPRWRMAEDEFMEIGQAMSTLFLPHWPHSHTRATVSHWHSFDDTGQLHCDATYSRRKKLYPLPVVHTLSERPTVVELESGLFSGPDFTHTVFKAKTVRHCANIRPDETPQRPHLQASHDIFEYVPHFCDL